MSNVYLVLAEDTRGTSSRQHSRLGENSVHSVFGAYKAGDIRKHTQRQRAWPGQTVAYRQTWQLGV